MKYILLCYKDEKSWAEGEREQCAAETIRLTQELHQQGKYLGSFALHAVATATSVRVRQGKRLVTDGPFAETREQLGGFFLIDAANLDEALDIAGRFPAPRKERSRSDLFLNWQAYRRSDDGSEFQTQVQGI
jgi:hypothetical protein